MRYSNKYAYESGYSGLGVANDSTAYDLSLFEHHREENKTEVKPLKKVKSSAVPRVGSKGLLFFVVTIVLIAALIYSHICLNEAYANIADKNEELALLQNEEIRLEMEVDSKVSLRSVEEYAKENLGLNNVSSYQLEYISLVDNSKIEVFDTENDSGLNRILNDVKEAVSR